MPSTWTAHSLFDETAAEDVAACARAGRGRAYSILGQPGRTRPERKASTSERTNRQFPASPALGANAAGLHALAQSQAERIWAVQVRALRDLQALSAMWIDHRRDATERFIETAAALSKPVGMMVAPIILTQWMVESVERLAAHAGACQGRWIELSVAATSGLAEASWPTGREALSTVSAEPSSPKRAA
jgi:hypothetical protein